MNDRRLRVALLGEGAQAERWASAVRGLAQLRPPAELPGAIDAVIVAPGARNPFAQTKEMLTAGLPVLYTAPFLLSPWQAAGLNELSRREKRLLRFSEPFQYRTGFAFLRRLLAGEEPFWRPLYLRSLRLAQPDEFKRIDELATEELAMCQALLSGRAQHVIAAASRCDDDGEVCAAFVTVQYADGPLVQCTVSLAEAASVDQLVVATQDRTVILDERDSEAPLRIIGAGEHTSGAEGPELTPSLRSRTEESPYSGSPDPVACEVRGFLSAVAEGDLSADNSDRWARVAALWWAARQSMSFGGSAEVPNPTFGPGQTEPPPLRVIQGGGKTAPTAGPRPSLTVVAR